MMNTQHEATNDFYLQALEIEQWELHHPERLMGYQPLTQKLAPTCQLLFVAQTKPEGEDAVLFHKILASMKLSLAQSQYVHPKHLSQLSAEDLSWVWMADDLQQTNEKNLAALNHNPQTIKQLYSSSLNAMHRNASLKRDLWEQIRNQLEV